MAAPGPSDPSPSPPLSHLSGSEGVSSARRRRRRTTKKFEAGGLAQSQRGLELTSSTQTTRVSHSKDRLEDGFGVTKSSNIDLQGKYFVMDGHA